MKSPRVAETRDTLSDLRVGHAQGAQGAQFPGKPSAINQVDLHMARVPTKKLCIY